MDDGSDESLAPILFPFRSQANLQLIQQARAGPAAARNRGLGAAKGRYVAFTDDDCEPDPDWLRLLDEGADRYPGCAVGGSTVNGLSANYFSTASQTLIQFIYAYWNRNCSDATFLASNNIAFPRDLLLAAGGFDTAFPRAAAEDRELCNRWRGLGKRIVYIPQALVNHYHALTFSGFFRQHFEYGRGAWRFWRRKRFQEDAHASLKTSETSWFYWELLRFLFAAKLGGKAPVIAGLIALAQVWMTSGYATEAYASWLRGIGYRTKVMVFEAGFVPAAVWPASLLSAALAPLLNDQSRWSRSHELLNRVEKRGPLFHWFRRFQERQLRRLCEQGAAAHIADRRPFVSVESAEFAGLVLKAPTPGEKGVLLLKNTERIDEFRRSVDMPRLLTEYRLVLELSWSGYSDPRMLAFTAHREHPILVMASSEDDVSLLQALGSNLIPVLLGCGDWVHPQVFRVLPGVSKKYDAILIARWTLLKRHHLLFQALREIGDPAFRVAIVARSDRGATDRAMLLSAIERLRLSPQIDIFEDLPPAQVNEVLNASKVNLLLSRQEGSNRALFEGFFANVPGIAFANHIGIPKSHVTRETGQLIPPHGLSEALRFFRSHWVSFQPRAWAMQNISPEQGTQSLNNTLETIARSQGECWSAGIVAKCNLPGLQYYPDAEIGSGLPSAEDVRRTFAK